MIIPPTSRQGDLSIPPRSLSKMAPPPLRRSPLLAEGAAGGVSWSHLKGNDDSMLSENIRRFRKARPLRQEELAERVHVVRQTVSKWENGLSVPDAEQLRDLAAVLGVSVSALLDLTPEDSEADLAGELARRNEKLAELQRREALRRRVSGKRSAILAWSLAALLCALLAPDGLPAAVLVSGCLVAAVLVLWRNLPLLTGTDQESDLAPLRLTTVFSAVFLVLGLGVSALLGLGILTLSQRQEELLAAALVACLMVFAGLISPKLPFNRHTGLRLPWTVADERAWRAAHETLGVLSLPAALLYLACVLAFPDGETVTLCAVALWLGIPALRSYRVFRGT